MYFNSLWTWSALYLNIIAALILPLIFLFSIVSFIIPPFSNCTSILINLLDLLTDFAHSSVHSKPQLWLILSYYLLLCLALIIYQNKRRQLLYSFTLLAVLLYGTSLAAANSRVIFLSSHKQSEWSIIIQNSTEEAYVKSSENWHDQRYIQQFHKSFRGSSLLNINANQTPHENLHSLKIEPKNFVIEINNNRGEPLKITVNEQRYYYELSIKKSDKAAESHLIYKTQTFSPKHFKL